MRILAACHGAQLGIPTHLRIDALFAGVVLGYYAHFDRSSFYDARKSWVVISGSVFALGLLIMPVFLQLTFAYVAFAFIVAWAANRQSQRSGYIAGLIAFIGCHSYSTCLWHAVVVLWLAWFPARWFRFPAYLVMAIVMGTLMSKLVEIPALRLREKLFPSIRPRVIVPQQARPEDSVPARLMADTVVPPNHTLGAPSAPSQAIQWSLPYYVKGLSLAIPIYFVTVHLCAWVLIVPGLLLAGRPDFRHIYSSAYMLETGYSSQLGNYSIQKDFQDRSVSHQDLALQIIRGHLRH